MDGDVRKLRQWLRRGINVVFSAYPLSCAAGEGMLEVVRFLIKEAGADVDRVRDDGMTALTLAAQQGHVTVLRCLVKEFGADVHQETSEGNTPLFIAAQQGFLAVVQCLVKECGADINRANLKGTTSLMAASAFKRTNVVVWLLKHDADAQVLHNYGGSAADISKDHGAPAEQTAYLEARAHCANPACNGAGLKKCAGCLEVFFCSPACIRAHWPVHKAGCKRISEAAAGKEK
jgi:ankyrin repeat protein